MNRRTLRVNFNWSRQRIGAVNHALNRRYRLPKWMLQQHSMDSLSETALVGGGDCEQATPDHFLSRLVMAAHGINPRCRLAR